MAGITRMLAGAMLASATALLPYAGMAQDDIRNRSVQDRPRPDYDPLGVRAGGFLVYPEVEAGVTYDTNIFADDDEEEDIILSVAPAVTAQSQWSRHELNVGVSAEGAAYVDNEDSNFLDIGTEIGGRFDVRRNSYAFGALELARSHEDRASPDDVGEEVNETLVGGLTAGYRHTINRIYVQPSLRVSRIDFEDDFAAARDRTRYGGRLRGGFAVSPRLRAFGEGGYEMTRYDTEGFVNRDNQGFTARVGAEVELTGVLFGELAAGVEGVEYEDNDLDDFFGPSAEGALTYNVTPLTSIVGTLNVGLEETTVVFDGDVASADFTASGLLEVFHELRRNVILSGQAGYIYEDFQGTGRADDTYLVGVGADYLLNRQLSLVGSWRFASRSSDDDNAEYDRHVFFVGLNLHL